MNELKNNRILLIDDNRAIHADFRKTLSLYEGATSLDSLRSRIFGPAPEVPHLPKYLIDSAYQGQKGHAMAVAAVNAGRLITCLLRRPESLMPWRSPP